MEYVFGSSGDVEVLKTKGPEFTDFEGFRQIERKYSDQTITDVFHIVRQYRREKDIEGNHYTYYEIDKHYRTTDRSVALTTAMRDQAAEIEDAVLELDASIDVRISALEARMKQ